MHVFGKVHSNWNSDNEARVREIAANPPIEQTEASCIGDYFTRICTTLASITRFQAPANAFLDAGSGSGATSRMMALGIMPSSPPAPAAFAHFEGLHSGFNVNTVSGDIYVEQTGEGDVKAQTGSGSIELKGVNGGLRAGTGSGDIKIAGAPKSDWKLETGSGSIEFWPGGTGFTLDASTGSGSVHSDQEMAVQGSFDRHHITGKVHGGGPTVRIETGSGDVRIH